MAASQEWVTCLASRSGGRDLVNDSPSADVLQRHGSGSDSYAACRR